MLSSPLWVSYFTFLARLVAKFGGPTLEHLWNVNQSLCTYSHPHSTLHPLNLTGGRMGMPWGRCHVPCMLGVRPGMGLPQGTPGTRHPSSLHGSLSSLRASGLSGQPCPPGTQPCPLSTPVLGFPSSPPAWLCCARPWVWPHRPCALLLSRGRLLHRLHCLSNAVCSSPSPDARILGTPTESLSAPATSDTTARALPGLTVTEAASRHGERGGKGCVVGAGLLSPQRGCGLRILPLSEFLCCAVSRESARHTEL